MMRSTKELRHVYRDFLLEANQSYSDIVVLEADLSSSMATNNLETPIIHPKSKNHPESLP
ncbi:transketolase c-terminal section [Streptococcus pneumoniae]|nr:transketolase c-terminal section [Streptococcus pneumoniae]CWB67251.1 transketolase c-terminal section [Streptococcus pneumoniae]